MEIGFYEMWFEVMNILLINLFFKLLLWFFRIILIFNLIFCLFILLVIELKNDGYN